MIRCFIIEDEPLAQEVLKKYIDKHPMLDLVGCERNPVVALEKLKDQGIELLFLDINLPEVSGLNFYKSLSKKPNVIFTTAYSEFAVDAFEVSAIDYLVKPFSFERFLTAVEKINIEGPELNETDYLIVKNNKKTFRIRLHEIKFIESIGDFVKIHTLDQVLISTQTLKALVEILPGKKFVRTHKTYIAAIEYIEYLEGNRLKIGESMIPIGQSYRESIYSLFRK